MVKYKGHKSITKDTKIKIMFEDQEYKTIKKEKKTKSIRPLLKTRGPRA